MPQRKCRPLSQRVQALVYKQLICSQSKYIPRNMHTVVQRQEWRTLPGIREGFMVEAVKGKSSVSGVVNGGITNWDRESQKLFFVKGCKAK